MTVWDVATGERLASAEAWKDEVGSISSLVFSPDGTKLAAGKLGCVRVFDARSGDQVGEDFHGLGLSEVQYVAFTPDGKRIIASAEFGGSGMWDLASGRQIFALPQEFGVRNGQLIQEEPVITLSADGARIAAGWRNGDYTRVWEVHP